MKSLVARRPAESSTVVAGAIVGILLSRGVIHTEEVGYATILVGALPMVVTGIVELFRGRHDRARV